MTKDGKKLQLCAACEEYLSCQQPCPEAIEFEKADDSDNYLPRGSYKAVGMPGLCLPMSQRRKK